MARDYFGTSFLAIPARVARMSFRIDFYDETVELDARPEAIGALLEDVEGWPSWSRGVTRGFRKGSRTDWRVGLMIGFVPKFLGLVPIQAPVIEYEANRRMYWGVKNPLATMVHGFSIESIGPDRSRVRHSEYAEGALGIGARPLRATIEKFDRDWTEDLVAYFAKK